MNKKFSKPYLSILIIGLLSVLITVILFVCVDGLYSVFNLLMLIAFTALLFVPKLIELIFKLNIPIYITASFIIFIFLSTLLGTIYNVYELFPLYDTILHALSGVLLGLLGLYILELKKESPSKLIKVLFIIGFSATLAVLWEVWEFSTDHLFNLNSQKHISNDGIALIGQDAINDTMIDLIAGLIGGIIAAISSVFIKLKTNKESLEK